MHHSTAIKFKENHWDPGRSTLHASILLTTALG